MSTPAGWFPKDDRTRLLASLLAADKVSQFRSYYDQLAARKQLRDRMGMIITIDRSGTARSIASAASPISIS